MIYHIYQDYEPSDPETRRRHTVAKASWYDCRSFLWANPVRPTRMFADVGRSLAYFKDIVGAAIRTNQYHTQWFLFTNTDICIRPGIERFLSDQTLWFRRVDFNRIPYTMDDRMVDDAPTCNEGKDAFYFSQRWWIEHQYEMPDMLLGAEGWDDCFYKLLRKSGATCVDRMIYHEYHDSVWKRKDCRTTIPSQLYNRELHQKFLATHAG